MINQTYYLTYNHQIQDLLVLRKCLLNQFFRAKFLLNEDPSNNREKQSLQILEKVSERRTQWTRRIQEGRNIKTRGEITNSMKVEEESNENDQFFQPRSSFGIKLINSEDEVEDEIPIRVQLPIQLK